MKKTNPVTYPVFPSLILTKDTNDVERKEHYSYRSVIGMLNFLTNSKHPELSFAVQQCTRFCNNPKMVHEQAVKELFNIY